MYYVCIGKHIVYIRFGIIYGFRHPLGSLGTHTSWMIRGNDCIFNRSIEKCHNIYGMEKRDLCLLVFTGALVSHFR